MADKLKIYACGTLVKTVIGNIEGMITCVNICFDKVQYEVTYFNNGEKRCMWMNDKEFTTNNNRKSIGFNFKQN